MSKDLISFGNLQRVLEEVLRQQRETTAAVQYLKATVEACASREYVDHKLKEVQAQVDKQDSVLMQLRTDMFDVSTIASELPKLAESQAAGLAAIEQRVNVAMHQNLIDMKQRTLDLEVELKEKAPTVEMRKLRTEVEARADKDELRRLIESTNKLRDSLSDRIDDITERIWGMRNEGESNLTETTSVLDSKLQSTQSALVALEIQQRSTATILTKLEKDLLAKVTYAEVGGIKQELFGQLQDVHRLLQEELGQERQRTGRAEEQLEQVMAQVEQRATRAMHEALVIRVEAHDRALDDNKAAIEVRATEASVGMERAQRLEEQRKMSVALETKAEVEAMNEMHLRVNNDVRRFNDEARANENALEAQCATLKEELNIAQELLARKADAAALGEVDAAHKATVADVSELKVDLESVLKNLEAWMFDEPLPEPQADPHLASGARSAGRQAAAAVAADTAGSTGPPLAGNIAVGAANNSSASLALQRADPRARASDQAPRSQGSAAATAGGGSQAGTGSAAASTPRAGGPQAILEAPSGRHSPRLQPGPPPAREGAPKGPSPRANPVTPPSRAQAKPADPPAAQSDRRSGGSPPGGTPEGGTLTLEMVATSGARTDGERKKRALEEKRRQLAEARLKGPGSLTGMPLPSI